MKRIALFVMTFVLVHVAVAGSIDGKDALVLAALERVRHFPIQERIPESARA